MALSLPRCAPPHPPHQLASIRQQRLSTHRLRRAARAKHGSTESSSTVQVASTDHIKFPSTEPCCQIASLVMVPRMPARRPSRLRVKKGREDKIDSTDMEAAEWVSRTLPNNGVVEVDPLTISEQIRLADRTGSTSAQNLVAEPTTTSSEISGYYTPTGGFLRVPFGVPLAAGSAIVLAAMAVLVHSLSRQNSGAGATSNQSELEGKLSSGSFAGESIKPFTGHPATDDQSRGSRALKAPHSLTEDMKLPAEVLANTAGLSAGAAIVTTFDLQPGSVRRKLNHSSMPLPPSLSNAGPKHDTERRSEQSQASVWAAATPFFPPTNSQVPSSTPNPVSSWPEAKYKSVIPFFPSDRVATTSRHQNRSSLESVAPFFPDEDGNKRRNRSSSTNATPFDPKEQSNESHDRGLLENITPFFADEQHSNRESIPAMEAVTPFFPDERVDEHRNNSMLETVTPFFAYEHGGASAGSPHSKTSFKYENVTPFFPDDRVERSSNIEQPSSRPHYSGSKTSQFKEGFGSWDGESNGESRDSLAEAMSPDSVSNGGSISSEGKQVLAEMANRVWADDRHREFIEGTMKRSASERSDDVVSLEGEEALSLEQGFVPEVKVEIKLSPEELAILEERKAEEERENAKYRALQAAIPAVAIGAGALGSLAGVDGAFQMVGLTATASFISYDLIWANKRKVLLEELSRITDHKGFLRWLQKRKIVKTNC
ncbi:uncharacterized protein [Physcomitrium patens]|uniref:Uncharacterized protein n=1 Tax=Physcomitrium patens TaxID=3218 RepID=A0A2K1KVW7_PHYPA|nr:uncharacterized protein LOC112279723 [Physcomitrium patens]PNR57908.1 hypothetical protein PHYPA_004902 [Physcomitrium patens]|eukprot:XP_024370163.1 uncharacterized protein LOC112279723 [Physcomitrella patens]